MNPILQVFYSVFSGLLLAIAIPNEIYLFGCPIYTLLALIPLYLTISYAKSYKWAFTFGFTQTITTHLASSFWLAYFKDFAALTLGASAIGTGFIGGFFGLFLYLPFSSSSYKNNLNHKSLHISYFNTPSFRIFYFSALYTLYEWVKSSGFLGYPWGTISAAMFKWPIVMQLSAITGTYGISFLIAIFNSFVAELIITYYNTEITTFCLIKNKRHILKYDKNRTYGLKLIFNTFGIIISLSLLYGVVEYYKVRKPIKTLNTILVQQNLDPWLSESDDHSILVSERLTQEQIDKMAEVGKTPDLVVWSEGCLRRPFPYSEGYYSYYPEDYPLVDFIDDKNVPFLIGGSYVRDDNKFYNAAIMFDNEGHFRGYYGKNHLVPFAESLPFIEYPFMKEIMEKIVGISAGWYPGDQYVYFEVPSNTTEYFKYPATRTIDLTQSFEKQREEELEPITVKFSTPICFDDAFTDIMRPMFLNGAELFVNITDDSWSLTKSSEIQHFAIAAYRAIEYRTTLIRSANAGYSVVVNPNGKVINDQPLFEESSTYCEVPIYKRTMTTYARFGNWLPYSFIILFFLYCIYSKKTFKKSDFINSTRVIKIESKKKSPKNKK